jgi:hypothetical protein
MAKRKKAVAVVKPEVQYCDLHVICQVCGSDQVIGGGIERGLQFVLTPDEKSFLHLSCDKCDASLKLMLKLVETTNENVPQENKQEESL